jgi:GNAT superfamily N-acetyltransferase
MTAGKLDRLRPRSDSIIYRPYTPEDSDAALALERRSAQGESFRLRFDRPWFHRRAENFECWHLETAWAGDTLVGVAGAALKPAMWRGEATRTIYVFDVRVAPEVRRSKVGQRLIAELIARAGQHARLGYGYAVADNEASLAMCRQWIGARTGPACAFLVYPTYKAKYPKKQAEGADPIDVHAAYLAAEGPFDLYCDPSAAFASPAFIGSWRWSSGASDSGCSAWTNAEIFAEVVERLPIGLSVAGALLRHWPLRALPLPKVPAKGETIRSWYLFDFFASDQAAALALIETVAAEARARGIDYCYLIHRGGSVFIEALRKPFPRFVAPIIPYTIIGNDLHAGGHLIRLPYIDIRDV